jgi:hypothetical protein
MSFLKKLNFFGKGQQMSKGKKMSKESNSTESTQCSEPDYDSFDVQQQASCSPCQGVPEKLFQQHENPKDKLVGVIVTIYEGSSYDEMFREIKPTTVPGERISTYSLGIRDVAQLHKYLSGSTSIPEDQAEWRSLVDDIHAVEADSVVFNWECCDACGDHCFPCSTMSGSSRRSRRSRLPFQEQPNTSSETMEFMALLLSRGHTAMCSDFSLKSLIYEWSEQHLGPNPFVKVGQCNSQFQLEFVPEELQHEDVPQQLQVVGELCREQGKAMVSAMGGTILYTVDPKRPRTGKYDLKILTVVTDASDGLELVQDGMKCSIGEGESMKKGVAGHVTLTYPTGGQLVTSMGHWIELTRINTTLESVLRTAGHNFGAAEADDLMREYASLNSDVARYECVQKRAHKLVQQSVPSKMKCRTKF